MGIATFICSNTSSTLGNHDILLTLQLVHKALNLRSYWPPGGGSPSFGGTDDVVVKLVDLNVDVLVEDNIYVSIFIWMMEGRFSV